MGSINILKTLSTFLKPAPPINLSNFEIDFFGNAENKTQGCWVKSNNATSVLCSPHPYNQCLLRPLNFATRNCSTTASLYGMVDCSQLSKALLLRGRSQVRPANDKKRIVIALSIRSPLACTSLKPCNENKKFKFKFDILHFRK